MAQIEEFIRDELRGYIGYYEELMGRLREESIVCTGIVKDQNNVCRMLRRNLRRIDSQAKRNYSSDLRKTFKQCKTAIGKTLMQNAKERGEATEQILLELSGRCQNAKTLAELKAIRNEVHSFDSWMACAILVEPSILHVENLWSQMKATADWDKEIEKLDARLTKIR